MTIGEHIMIIRKQKGLSQGQLGKKIGTSGDIIGRYERGVISPSIDVIIKISSILEVSIDFLVGKTNLKLDDKTIRISSIIDLSEVKNKEKLLIEQSKMAALGEMIGHIAHQWRQPLMELSSLFIPLEAKLNWASKPAHLGYIMGMLADLEFINAPRRPNGDINYTQFAKQVNNIFEVKTTENTLSKYLNTTTEKAQETSRTFNKANFNIPHKKEVS